LEHAADQIARALTDDGYFFLQDYVGEPRFQFADAKKRVCAALHDREVERTQPGRRPGVVFDDPSDLSPFCGVRSDDVLPVLGRTLEPMRVRTAAAVLVALMRAPPRGEPRRGRTAAALLAALMRAPPADGARIPPPGPARRAAQWLERRA